MKWLTVSCLLLFLLSCSNRTAIPDDVIKPDSMKMIMKDVFIANEYAVMYVSKDSLMKDKVKANQDLLEDVFKLHHTTKEEFKRSLAFYESRPDMNKNLFDSLSAYANQNRSEIYAPRTPVNTKPPVMPPAKKHIPVK